MGELCNLFKYSTILDSKNPKHKVGDTFKKGPPNALTLVLDNAKKGTEPTGDEVDWTWFKSDNVTKSTRTLTVDIDKLAVDRVNLYL